MSFLRPQTRRRAPSGGLLAVVLDWIYPLAAKRFKSYCMAVLIHGSEGLIIVVLVPMAIMGLLQN